MRQGGVGLVWGWHRRTDSAASRMVYVIKGGTVKYTMPDGSIRIVKLKTGEALIRPPVTHSDEALDDVEAILVEIKQ